MKVNKKNKYRLWIILCLCLDMFAVAWLLYTYADHKVPDKIFVLKENEKAWVDILDVPFVKTEEAVETTTGNFHVQTYLFQKIPLKKVKIIKAEEEELFVSGNPVGIYMKASGVLIIDTGKILNESGVKEEPLKNIVKPGDYILAINEKKIADKKELMEQLKNLKEENIVLSIERDGEVIPVAAHAVKDAKGSYKLGVWVRDDTQGIGTLTYITPTGKFGALGHGISDVDTGELLKFKEGSLYKTQILGILKGEKGHPGELSGLIRYDMRNVIGKITNNTNNGIYGEIDLNFGEDIKTERMPIGYKQEVQIGKAEIICAVDGAIDDYQAEIVKIDMNHADDNKSFVVEVTDENLLEKTGGIVQGMSGSPIIQGGKIIGAVTHVFVNDPTRGYGIFIENML